MPSKNHVGLTPRNVPKIQMTERLSGDDRAYHETVRAQMQRASAAWDSWCGYLAQKYRLQAGETIEVDGSIQRQPSEGGE